MNKALERLNRNMAELEDLINKPEKFGAWILLNKLKDNESKPPTNIKLMAFKINMEKEITTISRKIERVFGYQVPDGIKRGA